MAHEEHKMGHIQDFSIYRNVLLGLIALTIATVLVSEVHFGVFNTLIALLVAAIKASLVILYFMHGKYEGRVTWAFVWFPIFLLTTLVGALFLDYGFRDKASKAVQAVSFDKMHAESHGTENPDHNVVSVHSEDASHDEAAEPSHTSEPETDATVQPEPEPAAWGSVNGDPKAGLAKAKVLCIACHVVNGAGNALPTAPPFAQTANDPTKTPSYLRRWLKNPQSVKPDTAMPNFGLAEDDIENLIAFIHTKAE